MNCLHYACALPSLSMIIDLLPEKSVNTIQLDCSLRIPSEYIPLSHLTSKKSVLVYERERYFKHLHSWSNAFTASIKLTDRRPSHRVATADENAFSNVPEEREACWTDNEVSQEGRNQIPRLMKTKPFQMHKGSLSKIRLTRPNHFWSTTDHGKDAPPHADLHAPTAQRPTLKPTCIRHISLKSIVPRISSSIAFIQRPISSVLNSSPQIKSRFASSERLREKLLAQIVEVAWV